LIIVALDSLYLTFNSLFIPTFIDLNLNQWRTTMRRSASEILRNLEMRIARLERQAGYIPKQLKPFLKELAVAVQDFEENEQRKRVAGPITITSIDYENNVERQNLSFEGGSAYITEFDIVYKDANGKTHKSYLPTSNFDGIYYDDDDGLEIDRRDFLQDLKNKVYLD